MAKIVRVLTYEGTPQQLREWVNTMGVPLNGAKYGITSVIVSAEKMSCILCGKNETDNLTLICDECLKERQEVMDTLKVLEEKAKGTQADSNE